MQLVECVPNFSEGRDRGVIDAIAAAIRSVSDVKLLDVDPGADTNRTVYTFVGPPDAVAEAAFRGAARATDLIDMTRHHGAHPRMGALDVCPFVPVAGVTMDDCVGLAHRVGTRLADELGIPVYFYEHAASSDARRSLAAVRAGEYEGLPKKLADPAWAPDRGVARFNARSGATAVGAREFLIAYNVNLNTRDRSLAHDIALSIREAGRARRDERGEIVRDAAGQPVKVPGRLRAVRAIGWYIEEYGQAQVSINLLDFKTTPLHAVFETVCEEAALRGLRVTGSELVGMVPLAPLVDAGRFYLRRQGRSTGASERDLVDMAIRTLGLAQLGPFDAARKVVEYQFRPPAPLLALAVDRFVDAVASEQPAPGGGSVAALAGSLAAALGAMVAGVTVGKKGYEDVWDELSALAEHAQEIKASLAGLVDADTNAFNAVLEAMRLPKGTPEEQTARKAAVEAANQEAARVPLDTARLALEAIAVAETMAARGNRSSRSDAGVAALMGRAALEGAVLNVKTNLAAIEDRDFKRSCVDACRQLVVDARAACDRALAGFDD